jgi:hypothetical protein
MLDAPVDGICLVVEAAGITAQQNFDGVACALGNLSWPDASVEPGGERGMPEVVRRFG